MVNRITSILWPHLNRAIMAMAKDMAKPYIENALKQVRAIHACDMHLWAHVLWTALILLRSVKRILV